MNNLTQVLDPKFKSGQVNTASVAVVLGGTQKWLTEILTKHPMDVDALSGITQTVGKQWPELEKKS